MDTKVLFNIGYGLYVLTTNENGKDNGCIINTVMQVTSDPCQIAIAVNKNPIVINIYSLNLFICFSYFFLC